MSTQQRRLSMTCSTQRARTTPDQCQCHWQCQPQAATSHYDTCVRSYAHTGRPSLVTLSPWTDNTKPTACSTPASCGKERKKVKFIYHCLPRDRILTSSLRFTPLTCMASVNPDEWPTSMRGQGRLDQPSGWDSQHHDRDDRPTNETVERPCRHNMR